MTEQTLPAAVPLSCCPSLTMRPLGQDDAVEFARLFKAVADPTRLRLVSLVAANVSNEACVCDLTEPVGLGQPTVSHHLKILVDAGVLDREKRGVWSYYSIKASTLDKLAAFLSPA
ncbi:ArsR/SmtB family transcription factor [Brevibacterium aurantiacum]|uniref:Transcriptional regulator n=2 Tax=Brevibacterium aurantiacum TaxID=273384 RepID=A0A2A3ZL21_BREAU|nr:transcriptional regulator [Brevibacterium aurantiacum]